MIDYLLLCVSAILVNNILLAKFLGNCPFLGVSKKMETATGMGMAIIFVLTMAGTITWLVQEHILIAYGLEYLQTIFFILIIAALVQLVETVLHKSAPALYKSLGIFLPLINHQLRRSGRGHPQHHHEIDLCPDGRLLLCLGRGLHHGPASVRRDQGAVRAGQDPQALPGNLHRPGHGRAHGPGLLRFRGHGQVGDPDRC